MVKYQGEKPVVPCHFWLSRRAPKGFLARHVPTAGCVGHDPQKPLCWSSPEGFYIQTIW